MVSMLPDLAVIIVNWNTRQLLLDCLSRLPAASAGVRAEVWVVDNASADGSVEAVREQHPEVRVIANRANLGFAAANNQAIRASRSRHVLLLNSDTLPEPGSLAALVHFLDRNPRVGIAGPLLRNGDGSVQLSYASFPTLASELTGRNVRVRRPYRRIGEPEAYAIDWVGGACMAVRRSALQGFGLLDEGYFMYSEETDWCFRARRAGWVVCYLPGAAVVHLGGQSSRMASTRMKAELYRSKLRFFTKHYGRLHSLVLGAGLQGIFVGKAALGGLLAAVPGRGVAGRRITRDSGLMLALLGHEPRRAPAEVVR